MNANIDLEKEKPRSWKLSLGLKLMRDFLIFPVFLISTFYYFGFLGFCIAILVCWLARRIHAYRINNWSLRTLEGWSKFLTPFFVAYSVWNNDSYYLQILPSVMGCFLFLMGFASLWPNSPVLLELKDELDSNPYQFHYSYFMMGLALLLITVNEIVRLNTSLATWVWVYSFFIVEISILAIILLLIIMISRAIFSTIADTFRRTY